MANIRMKSTEFWNSNNGGLILMLIFIPLYLFFLGTPQLWEGDEGVHAEFAKQMYLRNDWISTYYNFTPRFDKPPLTFWTSAIFYYLFGVTEFASRLTSMLFGLLGIYIVYLFGKRVFTLKVGLIAGLILGSGFLYFLESQMILLDTALTFFFSWTLYLFYLGYVEGEPKYLWLMGFPIGFGILTKGPVALVLPGGIGFTYAIIQTFKKIKSWRNLFNRHLLYGIITALAVSLPWYIAIWRRHGPAFLNSHFGYHMFQRFNTPLGSHGGQAWYFYLYYILIIFIGFIPWSANVPNAFKELIKGRGDNKRLFIICWLLAPFIFFTISRTKLPGYIMPVFPPIALMIALWLEPLFGKVKIGQNLPWGIFLQLAAGLILSLIIITQKKTIPPEYAGLYPIVLLFPFTLILSAVIHGVIYITKQTYSFAFIVTFIAFYLYFALFLKVLTPVFQQLQPVKELSADLKKHLEPDDQVIANILGEASIPFYLGKHVRFCSDNTDLQQVFQGNTRVFAFVKPDFLRYLTKNGVSYYIVTHRNKEYIIVNTPITL